MMDFNNNLLLYNLEQLKDAIKTLSAIEQAVIFLLFERDLPQKEAAKILKICTKTVSKVKIRAIGKLKKYFKEVGYYE